MNKTGIKELVKIYEPLNKETFSFKVDMLIENTCLKETELNYSDVLKKNWNSLFEEEFKKEIVYYLKDSRRPYYTIHKKNINVIKNVELLKSIILNFVCKLSILSMEYYSKEEQFNVVKNRLKEERIEDAIIYKEIELFEQRYIYDNFKDLKLCSLVLKSDLEENLIKFLEYYHNNFFYEDNKINYKHKEMNLENNEITIQEQSSDEKKLELDEDKISEIKNFYEMVILNKNQSIEVLKKTIEDLEKKQKEGVIFATRQYDKGIKEFICNINDISYGNILDRLYCHVTCRDKLTLEELTGLINNCFIVLENMNIKPYYSDRIGKNESISKSDIGVNYRVNRDFCTNKTLQGTVKFPGWRLKESDIIKPMIELEEED